MNALLEALQPGEKDWDLAQAIDPARLPAHIAIIMDGNGRWAGRRFLPRVAGHKAGIGPVRTAVETCARLGVKALTLYAFSVENWKRPRAEVETLWRLLRYYLKQELPELQKNDIRLQAIGRLDALPPQVRRELDSAVDATSANRGLLVNLAINYGGRAEIVDAINSILDMARLDGSIDFVRQWNLVGVMVERFFQQADNGIAVGRLGESNLRTVCRGLLGRLRGTGQAAEATVLAKAGRLELDESIGHGGFIAD